MTSDEEILSNVWVNCQNHKYSVCRECALKAMKLARSEERKLCEGEVHGLSTARRLAEQVDQKEKEIQKLEKSNYATGKAYVKVCSELGKMTKRAEKAETAVAVLSVEVEKLREQASELTKRAEKAEKELREVSKAKFVAITDAETKAMLEVQRDMIEALEQEKEKAEAELRKARENVSQDITVCSKHPDEDFMDALDEDYPCVLCQKEKVARLEDALREVIHYTKPYWDMNEFKRILSVAEDALRAEGEKKTDEIQEMDDHPAWAQGKRKKEAGE